MRHSLSEFDGHHDDFELVGEQREEDYGQRDRRLPMLLLAVFAMAVFAGGLWFAYVQGQRHPGVSAPSEGGVPLILADTRPDKVKPEQPGGMAIPDQNVSLYNDKPGGAGMEKLLPAPEQPMPRPVAPPRETPALVLATPAPAAEDTPPPTAPAAGKTATPPKTTAQTKPVGAKPVTQTKTATTAAAPAAKSAKTGPVQLRLGSVRSPEAARDEWARLKRDNPDLLGKLTAVAVRADLGDQGIYYRIQTAPIEDAAAAERLCGELKRRKLGCLVAH